LKYFEGTLGAPWSTTDEVKIRKKVLAARTGIKMFMAMWHKVWGDLVKILSKVF